MSCKACEAIENWKDMNARYAISDLFYKIESALVNVAYDAENNTRGTCTSGRYELNYCPICGEPLSPPVPLTLEQLREMDGESVYVVVIDSLNFADPLDAINGWGIARQSWVRLWDSGRFDLIHIDHDFSDYGKTWLAYTRKPAEE